MQQHEDLVCLEREVAHITARLADRGVPCVWCTVTPLNFVWYNKDVLDSGRTDFLMHQESYPRYQQIHDHVKRYMKKEKYWKKLRVHTNICHILYSWVEYFFFCRGYVVCKSLVWIFNFIIKVLYFCWFKFLILQKLQSEGFGTLHGTLERE